MTNLDRIKKDLDELIIDGLTVRMAFAVDHASDEYWSKLTSEKSQDWKKLKGTFSQRYQKWYTEAAAVVRQLTPERLDEFIGYYLPSPKRKKIDATTYRIQDWISGIRAADDFITHKKHFDDQGSVSTYQAIQCDLLEACKTRFESSLHDIRQLVQADLFDSEVESARELLKKGFLRAAGAVCGVVLEKHLQQVCSSHSLAMKKADPTISDLNDPLKTANIYDVPTWRLIQRLGDIRNLCDHNKARDPTKDEVSELIDGTDKITKTVY